MCMESLAVVIAWVSLWVCPTLPRAKCAGHFGEIFFKMRRFGCCFSDYLSNVI